MVRRDSLFGFRLAPIFLLLLFPSLAGCSGLVRAIQTNSTSFTPLNAETTVGQTFVAGNDGLNGIQVFLEPRTSGEGEIQLHLRSAPDSGDDLVVSRLPVASVSGPGYYSFSFPPQPSSRRQYYYALWKIKGKGEVKASLAPGNMYLNGSAYASHAPLDAQLTFRLVYDPGRLLLGLTWEMLQWVGILAAGVFVFLLPGWSLLGLLLPGWSDLSWMEKLGLAGGMSLVVYPLLLLFTDLIGLHLGALYAWLPPAAGGAVILWKNRPRTADSRLPLFPRSRFSLRWPSSLGRVAIRQSLSGLFSVVGSRLSKVDLALLAVLMLLIFTRFWSIRSLEGPMWGDSYQHSLITQLLIDHGGLFRSWAPYADLVTFTYHFGFHSAAAVLAWITRASAMRAVLWTGQLLNLLAVLSLYPLALKVSRSGWGGVAALIVAGVLSPMPMFYTNWGRYTQLAGQAILPAVIYVTWKALDEAKTDARIVGLAILGFGGLSLTHLRVLIMAVIFLAAFLPLTVRRCTLKPLILRSAWIGVGAGLLFLPWFLRVFSGKIMQIFAWQITQPTSEAVSFLQEYNQIGNLFTYLPAALWLLIPLVVAWGLWSREKGIAVTSLWWFLLLILTNPQWLGLPGAGSISNFALFIAAYIPASLLIGPAFGWLVERFPTSGGWRLAAASLAGGMLLVVCLWGARLRSREIQAYPFGMLTRPDIRAASWIRKNTPADARFFVNAFLAFNGGSSAGSDGGWWLPLISGRQTTLPPMNIGFEQGSRPDYQQWVNVLTAEFQTKGINHPDFLAMLRERQVTYLYIGQQRGQVGNPGAPTLDPEQLLSSPNFRPIYHQDRVWIFQIVRKAGYETATMILACSFLNLPS